MRLIDRESQLATMTARQLLCTEIAALWRGLQAMQRLQCFRLQLVNLTRCDNGSQLIECANVMNNRDNQPQLNECAYPVNNRALANDASATSWSNGMIQLAT